MACTGNTQASHCNTESPQSTQAARTARREHISARADFDVITAELVEQVKPLDGTTRYLFGNDLERVEGGATGAGPDAQWPGTTSTSTAAW